MTTPNEKEITITDAPITTLAAVPAAAVATADEVAAIATSVAAVQGGNAVVTEVAKDVASAATDVSAGKGISDFAASLIRTATPGLVGAGLGLLATTGLHVPAAYEPVLDAGATFVLGGAYYTVVRAIEVKYPRFGWLLGVPRKPSYSV